MFRAMEESTHAAGSAHNESAASLAPAFVERPQSANRWWADDAWLGGDLGRPLAGKR
jgi:hypothetical protein